MSDISKSPLKPLKKIALSFSGGGFRAAAFCLGNLSYLHYRTINKDKDNTETLLSHVEFISSASGGSFANLGYAYYLYSDKTFDEYFQAMVNFMEGTNLLNEVFDTLNDDKIWGKCPDKGRNLINAFSIAYNNTLFHDANLGVINNPNLIKCLSEVCVNATEFDDGLSFRFQNSDGVTRNGKIGNRNLYLNTNKLEIISKIRLSDIVAASSCFPAGFEPMIFPNDFSHNNLTCPELSSTIYTSVQKTENKPIPEKTISLEIAESKIKSVKEIDKRGEQNSNLQFALMDGGIDDNQGIQSMMLAEERAEDNRKFDTLIACDVSSPFMSPFLPPKEIKKGLLNKYSLNFWGRFYLLFFIVLIILAQTEAKKWFWQHIDWCTVLTTIGILGLSIGTGFYFFIRSKYRKISKGSWGEIVDKYIGYFMKIKVGVLDQMVTARAESLIKMTTDIFLKQIRRMSYQLFYAKKAWENRRITATIYELSTDNFPDTEKRKQDLFPNIWKNIPKPSANLMKIAQNASDMGTTL